MAPHARSVLLVPATRARPAPRAKTPARRRRAGSGVILEALPIVLPGPSAGEPAVHAEPARRAPTEDEIRLRAYEIYLGRNGGPGDHLSDWNQAERELRASCDDLGGDRSGLNAIADSGGEPSVRGDTRQDGYGAALGRGTT
jgi:hypothetical protein